MADPNTVKTLSSIKESLICNLSLIKRLCAHELEEKGIPYLGCRPAINEDKDEMDLMYLLDDIAKVADGIKSEAEFMR